MTAPAIAFQFTGSTTANGTNHSVTLPATINRGDLLLLICASDGNPTMTPPTGWTTIRAASPSGTAVSLAIFGKSADGTEDGTSVTWTTSASEQTSTSGYRITGWGGTLEDISVAGAVATGTSNLPNPPNLNPANYGTEDFLWIAAMASDSNRNLTSGISGWNGQFVQGSGTGNASVYSAYLADTNSAQNPGTLQISASDEWVADTIAIIGTKILVSEDFEGKGTSPSNLDDMSALNTVFDLFNGVGDRKFSSGTKNSGLYSGQFETFGTNQALVKDTTHLPGTVNGGIHQRQLWFRGYFRTPDDQDIDNRVLVIEESTADGGDDIAVLRVSGTDGALTFLDGTTVRTSGTHQVDAHSHQHRIEMWVDQYSDYYEVRHWWGTDKDNPSTGATNYETFSGSFTNNNAMQVWGIGNYAGVNAKTRWDDVAIGIGGWIGPATVDPEEVEVDGSLAVAFSNSATFTVVNEVSASLAVVFSNTATLDVPAGAETIDGSLAVHFSNTAAFSVTNEVAGSLAVAFSNSAAFAVTNEISAALPITFSNTAAFSVTNAVSASLAVAFSNSASFAVANDVSASLPITFSNTASLAVVNSVSASLAVAFSNSAAFSVTNEVGASLPITFSNTATFAVVNEVSASLAVVFSNTAAFSVVTADLDITADLPITFSNTAALSVVNSTTASLAVAMANSAAFTVTRMMQASLPISFANSLAQTRVASISGALPITLDNSFSMARDVSFDAELAIDVILAAALNVPAVGGGRPGAGQLWPRGNL